MMRTKPYIEHVTRDDLVTWDHEDGVCKLILVPRDEIDEDSDEPDAWDLIWIEANTNLRRFEVRLDPVYRRKDWGTGLDGYEQERVAEYLATAPEEAAEILRPWAD